jgi:hypothetical protein
MGFCRYCGNVIEAGSAFCPNCGRRVDAPGFNPDREVIQEEEFRAFVGKKPDFYVRKFRYFESRGANTFAVTWNWSAFFLGFIWMLYRKMYLWSLAAFFIAFTPVAFPLIMIGWGTLGNYLYYLHARKKILKYKSRQYVTSRMLSLAERGGINRWVWLAGFILVLFLLFFLALSFQLIFHFLENIGLIQPQFVEI